MLHTNHGTSGAMTRNFSGLRKYTMRSGSHGTSEHTAATAPPSTAVPSNVCRNAASCPSPAPPAIFGNITLAIGIVNWLKPNPTITPAP